VGRETIVIALVSYGSRPAVVTMTMMATIVVPVMYVSAHMAMIGQQDVTTALDRQISQVDFAER
jgi:hypothetical protein